MMQLRVFIAHPSGLCEQELTATKQEVQTEVDAGLVRLGIEANTTYVLGYDDFRQNAARFGGWNGWPESVGTGKEYAGLAIRNRFDIIVVTPSIFVGKATAEIVRGALSARKPVLCIERLGKAFNVTSIAKISSDAKAGWVVQGC